MSAKSPFVRLRHMLENIDGILAGTDGMSAEQISGSYILLRAVERSVQIISEAAKELPPSSGRVSQRCRGRTSSISATCSGTSTTAYGKRICWRS